MTVLIRHLDAIRQSQQDSLQAIEFLLKDDSFDAPLGGRRVGGGAFDRAKIRQGCQSHHIISPTNSATKNHDLLERAGFNNKRTMDSYVNRILLPKHREYHPDTPQRPGRSLHNGRHT